jgi:hypothetical protein
VVVHGHDLVRVLFDGAGAKTHAFSFSFVVVGRGGGGEHTRGRRGAAAGGAGVRVEIVASRLRYGKAVLFFSFSLFLLYATLNLFF